MQARQGARACGGRRALVNMQRYRGAGMQARQGARACGGHRALANMQRCNGAGMQARQGPRARGARRALVNAVSVALRKGPSMSPSCTTPRPMSPPTTVPSVRSTETCGAAQGASQHG